jgi:hypothetical protein
MKELRNGFLHVVADYSNPATWNNCSFEMNKHECLTILQFIVDSTCCLLVSSRSKIKVSLTRFNLVLFRSNMLISFHIIKHDSCDSAAFKSQFTKTFGFYSVVADYTATQRQNNCSFEYNKFMHVQHLQFIVDPFHMLFTYCFYTFKNKISLMRFTNLQNG